MVGDNPQSSQLFAPNLYFAAKCNLGNGVCIESELGRATARFIYLLHMQPQEGKSLSHVRPLTHLHTPNFYCYAKMYVNVWQRRHANSICFNAQWSKYFTQSCLIKLRNNSLVLLTFIESVVIDSRFDIVFRSRK